MEDIDPPVVLVTGASRGLGRGIAVELASAGYSVVINYASNQSAAEDTVTACEAVQRNEGQRFYPIRANIAEKSQRDEMVEQVRSQMGRIDGLVNNAGIAPKERADIVNASEASFRHLIETNLQGPYFLTQRVVQYWLSGHMSPRLLGGFKIVFVTSISAHTASVNRGEYCISKAGLSMAAQLWATRLAAEGIQVYEVRPGIMLTDMTGPVKEKYDLLIEGGIVPQKRWGTGQDVGRAVRVLLEGSLAFSTGTIIDVDGGFHLRRL